MENYDAEKIIKKYKISLVISLFFLIIFLCVCGVILRRYVSILIFIYMFALILIKTYLIKKYITSALNQELNPQKYSEIISVGKVRSKHYLELIISSCALGDYEKTLNLCGQLLKDNKLKKYKYIYLVYIARCYFYTNNLTALKLTCDFFNESISHEKNSDKIKQRYPVFEFFNSYVNEDYKSCKAYLDKQKYSKSKYDKISLDFTLAVTNFKLGELEKAKEGFNNIIATAPLLNYASLSKKYIEAINNSDLSLLNEELIIDDNFELPNYNEVKKKYKKIKILRILILIFTIISVLLNVYTLTLPKPIVHFKGLDYYSTRSDIIALYGEPDEVRECIYPKGKFYDYYEKSFLGIPGIIEVEYLDNNNSVSIVQFIIDSKNFKSIEEYKKAVNKTYKYFDNNISKKYKYDEGTDYKIDVCWTLEKYGFSYMIYETQIMPDDSVINDETLSEATVFQFNTHRIN